MPITLTVTANTARELVAQVCAELDIELSPSVTVATPAQEVAPLPEAPKPGKRGPKPKNQTPVSDAASAPSAAPETAAAAPSTPSQAAAVDTSNEPPLPFGEPAPKEVTQEAMNEVLRSLSSAKGLGAVTDILGQFNCQRVKEVKPESRGDVIALAQAALAS